MKAKILQLCYICVIVVFAPSLLKAQPVLDFYGQLSFPQNNFYKLNKNNGLGAGFTLLSNSFFNKDESGFMQLRAGGNIAFSGFGSKKYELELAEPAGAMADVKVRNSMLSLGPVMRASFFNGRIQPYIEGFGGLNIFYANQEITPKNRAVNSDYEASTTTELGSSRAYYYGMGIGNLIKISDVVYGNVGIFYSRGNDARILPMNNIEKEGNELVYNFKNTPSTDMILVKFGFTFKLYPVDDEGFSEQNKTKVRTNTPVVRQKQLKKNEIKKNTPKPILH